MNKKKYIHADYIAKMGMLCSLAILISYIENLISLNTGIPGIKPGFANIVIVIVLYLYDFQSALIVNCIRIAIVGFLFGNVFSILFSLSGAIISLVAMYLIKKISGITIIGVSVTGGVLHNIGQIIVAACIVHTYSILYYIPVLLVAGIITGFIVGLVSSIIYERISKLKETKGDMKL